MTDETKIAERFARETADHELVGALDVDLHRHLQFRKPDTGFCWFDLVTWPGALAFHGDCGTYVFARLEDMFEFFRRGPDGPISPDYWSQKVVAGRDQIRRYSPEQFRRVVTDEFVYEARYGGGVPAGTGIALRKRVLDHDAIFWEDEARQILDDFQYKGWSWSSITEDHWEWDFTEWDPKFLWCCHAIVWGIAQYDKARTRAEATASV